MMLPHTSEQNLKIQQLSNQNGFLVDIQSLSQTHPMHHARKAKLRIYASASF
uniref:Uncharacterized protein n=1 Tax=Oryza brachyantha TaxID=4533 RepID=J3LDG5_ORYBR